MDNNQLTVISSQGIDQWNEYGSDLFKSFVEYWPSDIKLNLYSETFDQMPQHERINLLDLNVVGGMEYDRFVNDPEVWRRTKKFSHKAFSIMHALENQNNGFLIWIDADVVTKKEISKEWLLEICPDYCLTAHLGLHQFNPRLDKTVYGAETGFFVIN